MAEFEHLEEMVVGWWDRGIIGCAENRKDFITLKSGRQSPHYANFRGIMSRDTELAVHGGFNFDQQMRVRELTVDAGAFALDQIRGMHNFDHFAPIPQAVTQLGGAVALKANVSCVSVRVKEGEKGYGKHKPVEGDYHEGETVLGFDDVVTTGDAKEEFLEPISLVGLEVEDFMVLLDRQEGGRKKLEELGYRLTSVVGMYVVKNILWVNHRITDKQHDFLDDYLDEYGDLAA